MADKNLEQLLRILKASGADAWEVADVNEWGWEFYFIRHKLDQHRTKAVDSFSVKVYRNLEDGQFLGSGSVPALRCAGSNPFYQHGRIVLASSGAAGGHAEGAPSLCREV